jgi:hypothetical protein
MSYSPDLVERFTEGDCALLAVAVCDLLPGSKIALDADEYHAFVRLPDGRYLDIEGARSHREIAAQWGGGRRARLVGRDWLERHGWEPDKEIFRGSKAMVRRVARRLIREAGYA